MKNKKIMSLAFTASLLLGGAIPSYAEENPDNGIEPIPFENVESESTIAFDGLAGTPTAGIPIYCEGMSVLYLGSNEVVGQSVSASSSNLALIGVTGFTYKNGKYASSNTAAKNNSKNVSITNKATYSSGSSYQQDGTHKYVTYDGQVGITKSSKYRSY
ncbi:hypothetical protein COE99_29465 [Bacillus toyonensis]|uniref:hypothetical protein n=1 Tax=Bacillus toyonensis TaxID=155322 RepID=UPI000BFBC6A5|nr:hypothetical protein [Bacillus toyonensis]PHB99115.1 hypothetical protein COE99_29465 [Bacillus toyonensis]